MEAAIRRAASESHRRLLIDGRGARTVTVKLKLTDFRIESRSMTLPYATDDADTLTAAAFKIVRYPDEVGPIRLVGVSFSGLESIMQDTLFPDLDQEITPHQVIPEETGVSDLPDVVAPIPEPTQTEQAESGWRATQDVIHPEYGHGWVQGTGHGFVTVRFETRATGPGKVVNLRVDDPDLKPGDPIDSLAWDDWLER